MLAANSDGHLVTNNSVLSGGGKYAKLKANAGKSASLNSSENRQPENDCAEVDESDVNPLQVQSNGGQAYVGRGCNTVERNRSVNGSSSGGSVEELGSGGGAATYRLAGVEDVQVLARLQEESKRIC